MNKRLLLRIVRELRLSVPGSGLAVIDGREKTGAQLEAELEARAKIVPPNMQIIVIDR